MYLYNGAGSGAPAQHLDEGGDFLFSVTRDHGFLEEPQAKGRKLGVDPGFASLFHKQFECYRTGFDRARTFQSESRHPRV